MIGGIHSSGEFANGLKKTNLTAYGYGMKAAIQAWQAILGHDRVITDPSRLGEAVQATYSTEARIQAILYPQSAKQVQSVVRIAVEFREPLYPISRGKNWGYGSRVPAEDNCTLISLEQMNQIVDFDAKMGTLTVEPGVTFAQVYEYLESRNANWLAPAVGAVPDASVIGNALERGIGKGVYGDRFHHACNMEVVLPDGSLIHTSFGNRGENFLSKLSRYGVGPTLDGIFSQSNFGIVTRMTFWLQPKPGDFQTFYYTVKSDEQIPNVVEALRQLRQEGTITTTSTLSNDYRIYAIKQQFPFQECPADKVLPEKKLATVRKELAEAQWVGDDAILSATKDIGKSRRKRIKQILGPHVRHLLFMNNAKAKLIYAVTKPIQWLTGIDLGFLAYFHFNSLYLGKPLTRQVAMCYFRKESKVPETMDLDRDHCGVIWCSPLVPFQGEDIAKALDIMKRTYQQHELEPNLGMNFLSERVVAFTAAIIYDRDESSQERRAMQCYNAMKDQLEESGYHLYRLGTQSMREGCITANKEYNGLLKKIKKALDPFSIFSPNHYGIK